MDVFTIPGKNYDSNVFVVNGKIPTIIDTGTGFYSKEIIEIIQTLLNITKIQQVLLTHEHYDHVGGVNDFIQATKGKAKIFAHESIVIKLRDGKSSFAEMLGGIIPKIEVDVPLKDNQQITIGDENVKVLATPGHSNGSVCFYAEECGVLFSGDTVFAFGGFGRYDFPGGDFAFLQRSVERLAKLDVKSLYPGHGPIIETNGKDHVLQSLRSIRSLV
jgi:hydroxyacylglutathione hydrolase